MLDDEPASGPAVEHFVDEDALTDIEVVVLSRPEVQAEVTICGAQSWLVGEICALKWVGKNKIEPDWGKVVGLFTKTAS